MTDIASVGSTLVDALRLEGIDADLVDPIRPGRELRYPWKAAVLPLRAAGLLAAAARVRRSDPDLVHIHYARLGLLGSLCGRPYLVHCHGSDIRGVVARSAWGEVVGPPLRRAARVLYATPDLAPWVAAFRPDARFVPNPIALRPAPVPAERRDILIAVRLDPIKGLGEIRETVARVVALRPATAVTIVNHGRDVAGVRGAAGPQARLVDPVPHEQIPALLAGHRAVIGQMGLGVLGNHELEAMAAGLPTAATFRYPGAYNEQPPIIDAGSPAATAERLVALLDDEPARLANGERGRAWVTAHHDAGAVARTMAAIYAEILVGGDGRPGAA